MTWRQGLWPKFAVIIVLTYALTLSIYELGVRRWPLMRTVFGLGPMRRPAAEASPALSNA